MSKVLEMRRKRGEIWDEAKAFRAQYDNVGTVLVATSDAIVLWAKQQDWIDYIIPFHFSGLEKKFYTAQNWQDFTSTQTEQPLVDGEGAEVDLDDADVYFTPRLRPDQMQPKDA